jgi:hypothetical protein
MKEQGKTPKPKTVKNDVVYELECWVIKNGDKVEIHHTNNGGFPAPGQLGDIMNVHPAKLIVYKSPANHLSSLPYKSKKIKK